MSPCGWPGGCNQTAHDGPLCYWHTKVVDGTADPRNHLVSGAPGIREQERMVENLKRAGASEQVVERGARRPRRSGSSKHSNSRIPEGRVYLPRVRSV